MKKIFLTLGLAGCFFSQAKEIHDSLFIPKEYNPISLMIVMRVAALQETVLPVLNLY
jgi:hypothetical protein